MIIILLTLVLLLLIWPLTLVVTRGDNPEIARRIKKSDAVIICIYILAIIILLWGVISSINSIGLHTDESDNKDEIEEDYGAEEVETESQSVEVEEYVSPYEEINGVEYKDIPRAAYTCEFDDDFEKCSLVYRSNNEINVYDDAHWGAGAPEGPSGLAVNLKDGYGIKLENINAGTTGDYTISFWYKPYSYIPDWTAIFHAAYNLADDNSSVRVRIICKDSVAPIVSSEVPSRGITEDIIAQIGQQDLVGHWNHIVLVVNSSIVGEKTGTVNARLFVNGVQEANGDIAEIDMKKAVVTLGISIYDDPIAADYDSFKIFDYMLTDDQIRELYNAY